MAHGRWFKVAWTFFDIFVQDSGSITSMIQSSRLFRLSLRTQVIIGHHSLTKSPRHLRSSKFPFQSPLMLCYVFLKKERNCGEQLLCFTNFSKCFTLAVWTAPWVCVALQLHIRLTTRVEIAWKSTLPCYTRKEYIAVCAQPQSHITKEKWIHKTLKHFAIHHPCPFLHYKTSDLDGEEENYINVHPLLPPSRQECFSETSVNLSYKSSAPCEAFSFAVFSNGCQEDAFIFGDDFTTYDTC